MPIMPTPTQRLALQHDLVAWYRHVARDLPWRRTQNPYHIWLSEVMLQQTRVDQAIPYYERFTAAYPTVFDLAAAPLDEVLKNWEGLGYYARARNMQKAAQAVVEEFGGQFPRTEAEISRLAGIGPYTAAAVLSIAYQVPLAVLDGNVMRVLSRFFASEADIKQPQTQKMLRELANTVLNHEDPSAFNQGMMELGATVCTPKNPQCTICPLKTSCLAFAADRQQELPYAKPKPKLPHYQIAIALIFDAEGRILIDRRPEDGLLGGLWEFPGGKQEPNESLEETCSREVMEELGVRVQIGEKIAQVDHAYTHFKITMHAFVCQWEEGMPQTRTGQPCKWVDVADLDQYAFPKANRRVIEALLQRSKMPSLFDPIP